MKIIYNPKHRQYKPEIEIINGEQRVHRDQPDRVEAIVDTLQKKYITIRPHTKDYNTIQKVHFSEYLNFLKSMQSSDYFFSKNFNKDSECNQMTPYSSRAIQSALSSANAAISGAIHVMDGSTTFVLTRPPGHHAGYDYSRGFCFLNNAVIAAEKITNEGYSVGLLDFDLHHGNGTQELVSLRQIKYASIHESPSEPHSFIRDSGFVSENSLTIFNQPLTEGTETEEYIEALERALDFISDREIMIVLAGFNISHKDYHSRLNLDEEIFHVIGKKISLSNQKKLVVLEGGFHQSNDLAKDVNAFLDPISGIDFGAQIKISIIYHSESGNTYAMAKLIKEGCEFVENINSKIMHIDNVDLKYIRESSAVIVGSPTYYGGISWQVKRFLDTFEKKGISLEGKLGASFSSANWMGGGSEIALQSMNEAMLCYGMLVYSGGVYVGLPYNHLGAVSQRKPRNYDIKKSIKFGKDIALKVREIFEKN